MTFPITKCLFSWVKICHLNVPLLPFRQFSFLSKNRQKIVLIHEISVLGPILKKILFSYACKYQCMYQQKALHVCINCVPYQSSLDYILETTTRCIHRSILLVIDSRSMNIQLYVVCLCVPTTSSYYLLLCERNSGFEVEKEVSNKIPFWKVFRRQKETNLAFFFIGLIKITKHNATYTFSFFFDTK